MANVKVYVNMIAGYLMVLNDMYSKKMTRGTFLFDFLLILLHKPNYMCRLTLDKLSDSRLTAIIRTTALV